MQVPEELMIGMEEKRMELHLSLSEQLLIPLQLQMLKVV